jgi:hypothetical protein
MTRAPRCGSRPPATLGGMNRTVECPDCRHTAVVLGEFTVPGRNGPVAYLRIRCSGALALLVPAAQVTPRPEPAGR